MPLDVGNSCMVCGGALKQNQFVVVLHKGQVSTGFAERPHIYVEFRCKTVVAHYDCVSYRRLAELVDTVGRSV